MAESNLQRDGRLTIYHVTGISKDYASIRLAVGFDDSSEMSVYFRRDEAAKLIEFMTTAVAEYDAEHGASA